jgi:hypothetical protein
MTVAHHMSRTAHGLAVHQPEGAGAAVGHTCGDESGSTRSMGGPVAAVLIASSAIAPPGCTLAQTSTLLGNEEEEEEVRLSSRPGSPCHC